MRKCCDALLQIEGFTQIPHIKGSVTKYFKERHDLAQLYLDMVECVLRRYRKKTVLLETEEDLTDLYKSQLNRLGLVALNGLLNDKLDLNESELGNHAKDLTEFGFLDELVSDPRYFVLVAFWNLRLWQASQLRVSRNSGCKRPFKQINRQFVARYTR